MSLFVSHGVMCVLHIYHGLDYSYVGMLFTALFLKPQELDYRLISFAVSVTQLNIFMRGTVQYSTVSGCRMPGVESWLCRFLAV